MFATETGCLKNISRLSRALFTNAAFPWTSRCFNLPAERRSTSGQPQCCWNSAGMQVSQRGAWTKRLCRRSPGAASVAPAHDSVCVCCRDWVVDWLIFHRNCWSVASKLWAVKGTDNATETWELHSRCSSWYFFFVFDPFLYRIGCVFMKFLASFHSQNKEKYEDRKITSIGGAK